MHQSDSISDFHACLTSDLSVLYTACFIICTARILAHILGPHMRTELNQPNSMNNTRPAVTDNHGIFQTTLRILLRRGPFQKLAASRQPRCYIQYNRDLPATGTQRSTCPKVHQLPSRRELSISTLTTSTTAICRINNLQATRLADLHRFIQTRWPNGLKSAPCVHPASSSSLLPSQKAI